MAQDSNATPLWVTLANAAIVASGDEPQAVSALMFEHLFQHPVDTRDDLTSDSRVHRLARCHHSPEWIAAAQRTLGLFD
jgi:hypothetical protein